MRLLALLLALVFAADANAQGRTPPSGGFGGSGFIGTFTRLTVNDARIVKKAPTIAAGVLTLDLNTGNFFNVPLTANITTMTVSNPAATGTVSSFTLILRADGTPRTIVFPVTTTWINNGGAAPTPSSTSGKCDKYTAFTYDGGTTYCFTIDAQNFTCTA